MEQQRERPRRAAVPEQTDDEQLARELLARINAASVTRLGKVATIVGGPGDEARGRPDDADAGQPALPGNEARGAPEPGRPDGPDTPDGRPERDDEPHPRIYVASLGDLLVGSEHGVWLEADREPAELEAGIVEMLAASPWATDQWAIHEVEGFFGLQLSGFEDIGRISRLAQGLRAQGEALACWVGYLGTAHLDEALATFSEAYRGHFDSTDAYVRHLAETNEFARYLSAMPRHLLRPELREIAAAYPDTAAELYIVESRDGGLYVFDASEDAS